MSDHIYTEKVLTYTEGMAYKDFICNDLIIEACVFNLSQLGELSNKLDDDFQERNSAIPWKGAVENIYENGDGYMLQHYLTVGKRLPFMPYSNWKTEATDSRS